eukprot:GHVU01194888.1.p1 GENE.GHVU01194888.1~~GHVU01194888.1.p1  ORF type:complete len:124 (-),score=1.53 GHVU01194888.1:259-630(-)
MAVAIESSVSQSVRAAACAVRRADSMCVHGGSSSFIQSQKNAIDYIHIYIITESMKAKAPSPSIPSPESGRPQTRELTHPLASYLSTYALAVLECRAPLPPHSATHARTHPCGRPRIGSSPFR